MRHLTRHVTRHPAASCLVGICLVAGLAGCGSGTTAKVHTESASSTPTTWAPPPPPAGTTTLINTGDYRFHTASGNITCHVVDVPKAVGARCDIAHYTYQPPASPGIGCPHYNAITIGVDGPAEFTCTPEAPAPADAAAPSPLAYWDSVQLGRFTCKSKDTGVTCENTQTNHGFELGAAAFRRY